MAQQEPRQINGRQKRKKRKARHLLLRDILQFEAVRELVADLEATQWTGRKGYPISTKVAAIIAQYLYGIPTITELARSLRDNSELRKACGIKRAEQVPSEDALYRFRKKLIANPLHRETAIKVVNSLALLLPDFGHQVAIDATDVEAFCNTGRKHLRDTDAAWGKRNFRTNADGSKEMDDYYGYKLHLIVDANHEIPIRWDLTPANTADCTEAVPVFEEAKDSYPWFAPEYFCADKGYDAKNVHEVLEGRYNCHPIIPLRDIGRHEVLSLNKNGHPHCNLGTAKWMGTDYERKRSKWHCPVKCGEMKPVTKWSEAFRCCCMKGKSWWLNWADDPRKHSLVPRRTKKFEKLYNKRGSVEREFSRLKSQFILDTIRVQGIDKVKLHVDLTILVRLLTTLADLSPP